MCAQPVNDGVTGRTEGDQPGAGVPSRFAVMNGALARCTAPLAAMAVAHQNSFAVSGEVPSRVGGLEIAAAAKAGDGRGVATGAEEAALAPIWHWISITD